MRVLVAILTLVLVVSLGAVPAAAVPPDGTMAIGVHVTLVSRWLDPGETEALSTPCMVLCALHDALVKPMPGGIMTPSLAESWIQSKDGLSYEFVIRKNARFHTGDPVTAEDVKFTFERYKGSGAKLLKTRSRRSRCSRRTGSASCSRSRGRTSWPSTAPRPPEPAGSCPRSTSRRSARRRTGRPRWARGRSR